MDMLPILIIYIYKYLQITQEIFQVCIENLNALFNNINIYFFDI
jgi:hypothetical protein